MIEVEYEGNTYAFCKGDKKGYWIGLKGGRNKMYPGAYCAVPLAYYNELQKKALEDGHEASIFRTPKKEKKVRTPRVRAKKEAGIKIF